MYNNACSIAHSNGACSVNKVIFKKKNLWAHQIVYLARVWKSMYTMQEMLQFSELYTQTSK